MNTEIISMDCLLEKLQRNTPFFAESKVETVSNILSQQNILNHEFEQLYLALQETTNNKDVIYCQARAVQVWLYLPIYLVILSLSLYARVPIISPISITTQGERIKSMSVITQNLPQLSEHVLVTTALNSIDKWVTTHLNSIDKWVTTQKENINIFFPMTIKMLRYYAVNSIIGAFYYVQNELKIDINHLYMTMLQQIDYLTKTQVKKLAEPLDNHRPFLVCCQNYRRYPDDYCAQCPKL